MSNQKVTLELHHARSQNRTTYPIEELPQKPLRANAFGIATVRNKQKPLCFLSMIASCLCTQEQNWHKTSTEGLKQNRGCHFNTSFKWHFFSKCKTDNSEIGNSWNWLFSFYPTSRSRELFSNLYSKTKEEYSWHSNAVPLEAFIQSHATRK